MIGSLVFALGWMAVAGAAAYTGKKSSEKAYKHFDSAVRRIPRGKSKKKKRQGPPKQLRGKK